jgi:DNA repair protein RadC
VSKAENLHAGHRQRVKEEYWRNGLPPEPYKQLEILLFYALKQIDTNELAHRLINRFGSLRGVLEAPAHELKEVEGVGRATAEFLHIIGDVARMVAAQPADRPGTLLDTHERREAFIRKRLDGKKHENILIAYLDAKKRLIHEWLCENKEESAARVKYSLRTAVINALKCSAVSILAGHNHPDSNPMPSQKDIAEAVRLKNALHAIGVNSLDFIIVGEDGETYSLKRGGLIS